MGSRGLSHRAPAPQGPLTTGCPLTLTRRPGCSIVLLRVALLRRSLASVLPSSRQLKARGGPKRASLLDAAPGSGRRPPLALPLAFFLPGAPGGPRPGARSSVAPTLAFTVRLLTLTSLSGLDRRQDPEAGRGGCCRGPGRPARRPPALPALAGRSPSRPCRSFFFLAFWLASILTTEEGEGPSTAMPGPACGASPGSLRGASVPRRASQLFSLS